MPGRRRLPAALVAGTSFLSLSSAAVAGLALQGALMSWNSLLKRYGGRWKILWSLLIAAVLVIEFGSNQTPIKFYISHFTFDSQTAWFRILTWDYASASVLNHPLFGIGFAEWDRPKWMASDSIDNFWLVTAVRYGIPAIVLLIGSCLWLAIAVSVRRLPDKALEDYRVAYLICIITYFVVGTTVHFWASTYVWFMFLLGSGAWLLDARANDKGSAKRDDKRDTKLHTRPPAPNARTPSMHRHRGERPADGTIRSLRSHRFPAPDDPDS